MPILDQTYQHWSGTPHHRPAALVLGRSQVRLALARRTTRFLLLAGAVFVLVWVGFVYVESQMGSSGMFGQISEVVRVDASSFRNFMRYQHLVHLLLCLALADLIAIDRRAKALQLYLARPLRPADYVLAKALALAVPLSLTTWVPGLFIVLLKVVLRGDPAWLGAEPWLPAAIVAYGAILIVALSLITLAVSSLCTSPRQASALVFAILALTSAAAQVLAALTRSDQWLLLSVDTNLDLVASLLFATPPPHDLSPWAALGVLAAASIAAALVLRQRIRPLEVVT